MRLFTPASWPPCHRQKWSKNMTIAAYAATSAAYADIVRMHIPKNPAII